MYVAVKGGERAIDNAHALLAEERRGDPDVPELQIEQIEQQLTLLVDRVMTEGALYDRRLAALAIKQARGDAVEAIYLLRAWRTTLTRFGYSEPVQTGAMQVQRRISAAFKDVPGGQVLGPTFDYTHRLLDFSLMRGSEQSAASANGCSDRENEPAPVRLGCDLDQSPAADTAEPDQGTPTRSRVLEVLAAQGLVQREVESAPDTVTKVADITRDPIEYPASREVRLQSLARADEGFLLALGYSTQRGYGRNHPFVGEMRLGWVAVELVPEELGFAIEIGEIQLTECDMINQFQGDQETPPCFTRGYGLSFGYSERKAMAMALVDRALQSDAVQGPAQDQEFVLAHADNVEASGFVQHLKLPHYVDFQSELELLRRLRQEHPRTDAGAAREPDTETQHDAWQSGTGAQALGKR